MKSFSGGEITSEEVNLDCEALLGFNVELNEVLLIFVLYRCRRPPRVKSLLPHVITGQERRELKGQEAAFVLGRPQRLQKHTQPEDLHTFPSLHTLPLTVASPRALLGNLQAAQGHKVQKSLS